MNNTENAQEKQLKLLEIRDKEWKKITEKLKKWVKGKGNLDELTQEIYENLDEEKVEQKALNHLGVAEYLIDQKQLWRINASTNYDRSEDIRDLLEWNQEWIKEILSDWRAKYLGSYIEERLGERQSSAIAYEVRDLLKGFEY
jgi:hypothetical protein